MQPTSDELAAARNLADALVRFLVAIEDGASSRRSGRPREEITVKVEQKAPPPLPHQTAPAVTPVPARSEQSLLMRSAAAKYLGISATTLWSLTAGGAIPRIKIRGCVRYSVSDLDAYIERLKKKDRRYPFKDEQ